MVRNYIYGSVDRGLVGCGRASRVFNVLGMLGYW